MKHLFSILTPSCDRTNDYLGYSLDRLEIKTWQENRKKFHLDNKNGINKKNWKAILQFTKNGGFIKEYPSIITAEKTLGINHSHISQCCSGSRNTTGGYIWKFKNKETKG